MMMKGFFFNYPIFVLVCGKSSDIKSAFHALKWNEGVVALIWLEIHVTMADNSQEEKDMSFEIK